MDKIMISRIQKHLIIACISAAAISVTLIALYTANSNMLKKSDSKNSITDTDSVFKNYNPVSQSVNLLDLDLSDEDFTGDAAPLLEQ